ncbi:response regulator transcription factor [Nocardiopsis chromatogenes]|uniref:response regulator transcription factor n=1 Tax=Nocardiopsis chromatogenes TaxID=280239 RepID=UPI00034DF914|nr:response regulator transcription factor [Nocardiopsis chromatogenes]
MRLVLADDSVLLREGLVRLLEEAGHEVVATAGDATDLDALVERTAPDVAVIDVRMPPTNTDDGLRAALRLRESRPRTGVLVLSQYIERGYATRLLTGAPEGVGYLLKDRISRVSEFLDALERVASGGTAIDPEVVRRLLAHAARPDPLALLTAREREVLEQMAQGYGNASIARNLVVSQSAVEKHVGSLFDKLGLTHTTGYSRRVLAVLRYLGV